MTSLHFLWTYGLPLIAMATAWQACVVSQRTRDDARVISGLDLVPRIDLWASLDTSRAKPPHFTVCNPGPLDLAQVEASVIRHYYNEERPGIGSASGAGDDFTIGDLAVSGCESRLVYEHNVDVNSPLVHKSPEHTAIELRLHYRHPVSRQRSRASAYYFLSADGHWLLENDQRVDENVKREIISGASDSRFWDMPAAPLHIQRDVEREAGAF